MNKMEIKDIPHIEKDLLNKIEHILGSELNCDEYDMFYNYFNEIKKPDILVEIKDCEEIINCIQELQQENKEQEEYITYWQNEYDQKVVMIDKIKTIVEKRYKLFSRESDKEILEILKGE